MILIRFFCMWGGRDGLYAVCILHTTTVACGWSRTLHQPPPVELSHELLRIVGQLALETQPAGHTAWSSSDCLGAALLLAPPAPAMCPAMLRASCLSSLGQPKCWHRLPPAVRLAMLRAVLSSGLGTALLLAPPATAVAMQFCVPPSAPFKQPSSWHRLPPPCTRQCPVFHH